MKRRITVLLLAVLFSCSGQIVAQSPTSTSLVKAAYDQWSVDGAAVDAA